MTARRPRQAPPASTIGATGRRRLLLAAAGVPLLAMLPAAVVAQGERLEFKECWAPGMKFTDKVQRLDNQAVRMRGFMAPPLKPDADFFVMTRTPMSVCPFCETEAEWPDDIILVRLADPRDARDFVDFNVLIETRGTLQIGTDVDAETGFVSRLRIIDARFEAAR